MTDPVIFKNAGNDPILPLTIQFKWGGQYQFQIQQSRITELFNEYESLKDDEVFKLFFDEKPLLICKKFNILYISVNN